MAPTEAKRLAAAVVPMRRRTLAGDQQRLVTLSARNLAGIGDAMARQAGVTGEDERPEGPEPLAVRVLMVLAAVPEASGGPAGPACSPPACRGRKAWTSASGGARRGRPRRTGCRRVHAGPKEHHTIAEARDRLPIRLGSGQCRQKHPGQDRDDGDHDQQFDQGESLAEHTRQGTANQANHGKTGTRGPHPLLSPVWRISQSSFSDHVPFASSHKVTSA